MAIVGGGGNVGGASFSITGDPSGALQAIEKVKQGFNELAESLAGITQQFQQTAEGVDSVTAATDRATQSATKLVTTYDDLLQADVPTHLAGHFQFIGLAVEELIDKLNAARSELTALTSAAPITRIIPSDEVARELDEIINRVTEAQAAFGQLIPGDAFARGLSDMERLGAQVRIIERAMAEGWKIPEEGIQRLETFKRLQQEIADQIGLVKEIEPPTPDLSKVQQLRDALREVEADLRDLSQIPIAPELRTDELQAEFDILEQRRDELLAQLSREVPPVEIRLIAPTLDQIIEAISEVEGRLQDLSQFEIAPAFRTDEAQRAIDILETHLESLQSRARQEMPGGESLAQSFVVAGNQLERLNGELLNIRLRFEEAVPPEVAERLNQIFGEADAIIQKFAQPIEFSALTEGVRSAEDLIAVMDLLEQRLAAVREFELNRGSTDATRAAVESLTGALGQTQQALIGLSRTRAMEQVKRSIQETQTALTALQSSKLSLNTTEAQRQAEELQGRLEELQQILDQLEQRTGRLELKVSTPTDDLIERLNLFDQLESRIQQLNRLQGPEAAASIAQLRQQQEALGITMKQAFEAGVTGAEKFQSAAAKTAQQIDKLNNELLILGRAGAGRTDAARGIIGQINQLRGGLIQGTGAANLFSRAVTGMSSFLGRATTTLAGFGLSLSDVAIVMGAGFAGGLAGAIQVAQQFIRVLERAVKAVIEFATQAAFAASQFESLLANVAGTFEGGSEKVQEFAKTTALAFGVARVEALQYLNTMGQLFRSYGVTAEAADDMAIATFAMAEGLRRGLEATKSFADAQKVVRDILSGNLEAARDFGFSRIQQDIEKVGERLGVATKQMDSFTRNTLAGIALAEEAMARLSRTEAAPQTVQQQFEKVRAVLKDITLEIGQELLPVFKIAGDIALGFAVAVRDLVLGLKGLAQLIRGVATNVRKFIERNQALIEAFKGIGDQLQRMFPGLSVLAKILGVVIDTGQAAQDSASAYSDEMANLTGFVDDATRALYEHQAAQKLTIDQLKQLRDAHERVAEAIEDGEKQITEAREARDEAIADAIKREEDAQKRLDKARRDRLKAINEQLEHIKEIEEENRENILDAIEALKEAQEEAAESIKEAEEKLQDARIDGARKVRDAERQLHEARMRQLDQFLDARLALEDALAKGDAEAERRAQLQLSRIRQGDQINEAERKKKETIEDVNERIKEAEEDLAEARIEALERVQEAEDKLTDARDEAREKLQEAEEKLTDIQVEMKERVQEADDNLTEVQEENAKRVKEAKERLLEVEEKVKKTIDDAKEALLDLNQELGTQSDSYTEILDQLERELVAQQQIRKEIENQTAALEERKKLENAPGPPSGSPGFGYHWHPDEGQWHYHGRQHGGPLGAGQLSVVGESGPELFIPNQTGRVISNEQLLQVLRQLAEGHGGGVAQNITINEVAGDPEATAFAVASRLLRGVNN